jgi:galactokinase/mevalonate kinase-like predicted kinase
MEWDIPDRVRVLHNLRAVAEEMRVALEEGSLDLFARLLDLGWSHERSLADRPPFGRLEAGYCAALDAGAAGGRSLSPSLLLLYGSRVTREAIEHTMATLGWMNVPFQFDTEGVQSSDGSEPAPWPGMDGPVEREVRSWSPQSRNLV